VPIVSSYIGAWRSLDSVLAWGASGRQFKSARPDFYFHRLFKTHRTWMLYPFPFTLTSPFLSSIHASDYTGSPPLESPKEASNMAEPDAKCVQPAGGPLDQPETDASAPAENNPSEKEIKVTAKVGMPAPDFEANAFVDGRFKPIKLSDYKGKWVVICFYPGDFTFV
jgi:hypothetical protein